MKGYLDVSEVDIRHDGLATHELQEQQDSLKWRGDPGKATTVQVDRKKTSSKAKARHEVIGQVGNGRYPAHNLVQHLKDEGKEKFLEDTKFDSLHDGTCQVGDPGKVSARVMQQTQCGDALPEAKMAPPDTGLNIVEKHQAKKAPPDTRLEPKMVKKYQAKRAQPVTRFNIGNSGKVSEHQAKKAQQDIIKGRGDPGKASAVQDDRKKTISKAKAEHEGIGKVGDGHNPTHDSVQARGFKNPPKEVKESNNLKQLGKTIKVIQDTVEEGNLAGQNKKEYETASPSANDLYTLKLQYESATATDSIDPNDGPVYHSHINVLVSWKWLLKRCLQQHCTTL